MSIDVSRLGPNAQRKIAAKSGGEKAKKGAKYGNVKTRRTLPNGTDRIFDSRREAERYDELLALERAGAIRALRIQPHFTLREPCVLSSGEKVAREEYIADFSYERRTEPDCTGAVYWVREVEDVKGVRTAMYLRKKNEMLDKYGISIREV